MSKVERRRTAHITEGFRKFTAETLSDIFGVEMDEDTAFSLYRLVSKIPLRFLISLPDEEKDVYGDKSIPVPGVGKFKIYNAKASGRKEKLVGSGESYPRFKFYPANSIESEVEVAYSIADEDSKKAFERVLNMESKMAEKVSKRIAKLSPEEDGNGVDSKSYSDDIGKALSEIISELVREELSRVHEGAEDTVVSVNGGIDSKSLEGFAESLKKKEEITVEAGEEVKIEAEEEPEVREDEEEKKAAEKKAEEKKKKDAEKKKSEEKKKVKAEKKAEEKKAAEKKVEEEKKASEKKEEPKEEDKEDLIKEFDFGSEEGLFDDEPVEEEKKEIEGLPDSDFEFDLDM